MDPGVIAAIITVVSLGCMVGLVTWLLVTGRAPQYPGEVRADIVYRGTHYGVICADPGYFQPFGIVVGKRLDCVIHAWSEYRGVDPRKALRNVIVYCPNPDNWVKWAKGNLLDPDKAHAFQTYASAKLGSGPPLIVISPSWAKEGLFVDLVGHEALHVLCSAAQHSFDDNHMHGDQLVWGPLGIERIARDLHNQP